MTSPSEAVRYPLLEALLAQKGLKLKGTYTIRDVALIFGASRRTLQEWTAAGNPAARDLPGRGRFLSEDLENFLQSSLRQCEKPPEEVNRAGDNAQTGVSYERRKRLRRGK